MIARVLSAQGTPERIDEFAQWWQNSAAGLEEQLQGFQSAYLLADRQSGRGQVVALWESREAAEAAMPQINQTLQQSAQLLTGPPQIEEWEVVAQI